MIALRALAVLLSYPQPEIRLALPDLADVLSTALHIPRADRDALLALIEEIAASDQLDAEERYVDLFDRGRATSLNLFEHLHGDARDRGSAMVELKRMYERAGFTFVSNELPDHLPVLLEYLSERDPAEVTYVLGDCAHIVRSIGEALLRRGSRYAAVPQAILRIAGQPPLDPARAARRPKEQPDLDHNWAERPAFEPDAATIAADPPF